MFIVTGQRSEPEGKEKSFVFEEPINHFTTESRNIKEKSIETLEGSHLSMEEWLINHDEDFNDVCRELRGRAAGCQPRHGADSLPAAHAHRALARRAMGLRSGRR